jgi:isopentenyl-diphosphate Delta-isomerase
MTPAEESARVKELRALREESVVLVDAGDRELGTMSKLLAHQEGRLHRAVSVLVRDRTGALLLQRRAAEKYHSPGLWSNSCCGHPRPGESPLAAATRRLREELGIECELAHAFTFSYEAALGEGMREHEVDHVFVGQTDDAPVPDPAEVGEWRRVQPELLRREMDASPETFTVWFRVLMERIYGRDPFGAT